MAERLFRKTIPAWVAIIGVVLIGVALYGLDILRPRTADSYTFKVTDPVSGKETELAYGSVPALSNPDFYASAKEELIKKGEVFIEANLSDMKLRVYEEGNIIKEVDILTKGRKGSWWETPAGLYKAESKSSKHLSSFSPVYTPWNIPFQGNFFIHGWPYWADSGEDVTSAYSGGCIRLSTEDAKAVYDLVKIGTPILVFEESDEETPYEYITNIPEISSTSYLAADLSSNYVFLERNAEEKQDMSAITNFLNALVATDYMNIERSVTASAGSLVETQTPRLQVGGTYTVYDLMFPLLIEASNEAAATIARPLGEGYFTNLMQKKAESIGMANTTVESAHGGTGENTTTAEDVYHLANFLHEYRKFVLDFSRGVVTNSAYGESVFSHLRDNGLFVDNSEYRGGIVGVSEENGESGLALFEVQFGDAKRPIAIAVFGSENAEKDIDRILDYIKTAYK